MKNTFAKVAAAAALSAAAFSAQAVTLNLSGYANGSVQASGSTPTFNTGAGAFVGTLAGAPGFDASPFYTYCVQLTQFFSFNNGFSHAVQGGSTYFDDATLGAPQHLPLPSDGATIVDRLGKLFTSLNGLTMPLSTTRSAAIQLVVWESIYEGGIALDLGTGAFKVSSTTNDVLTEASTILAGAAAVTKSLYSISVLESDTQQDFLLVSRTGGGSTGGTVPEPASLGLVALALGGLALSRRRRA